jgi:hypothetical protein
VPEWPLKGSPTLVDPKPHSHYSEKLPLRQGFRLTLCSSLPYAHLRYSRQQYFTNDRFLHLVRTQAGTEFRKLPMFILDRSMEKLI